MAAPNNFPGDVHVGGTLSTTRLSAPAGAIANVHIAEGATGNYVEADKIEHCGAGIGRCLELFGPAVTVAALTKTLFMAKGVGTLVSFGAWIEVLASGADRTAAVDLQKSTGGGAYATVLSATANFTNGSTVRVLVSATISSAGYVAGDVFRAIVSVGGAAGSQATGLGIQLTVDEEPR